MLSFPSFSNALSHLHDGLIPFFCILQQIMIQTDFAMLEKAE